MAGSQWRLGQFRMERWSSCWEFLHCWPQLSGTSSTPSHPRSCRSWWGCPCPQGPPRTPPCCPCSATENYLMRLFENDSKLTWSFSATWVRVILEPWSLFSRVVITSLWSQSSNNSGFASLALNLFSVHFLLLVLKCLTINIILKSI